MLVELAIGDSYGYLFEFISDENIKAYNNFNKYQGNYRYIKNNKLVYSDDTQQSIAIAELLIQYDKWTEELVADKLVEVFKRDKRQGYSRASYEFLNQANNGKEFMGLILGNSDKCGAAMRAMPIGILPSVWDVIYKANLQATVTHNSFDGRVSATGSALMAHYFIYDIADKAELPGYLEFFNKGPWNKFWDGDIVTTNGIDCVHAAYTMIMKYDNMVDILRESVNLRGDTDTVCAIALAIASNSKEIEQNLPEFLYDDLENGEYGRDYLKKLDDRLFALKG